MASSGSKMLDAVRDRILIINPAGRVVYTNAAARGDFSGALSAVLASPRLRDALKEIATAPADHSIALRLKPDPTQPENLVEVTLVHAPNGTDTVVIAHADTEETSGNVTGKTVAELLRQHLLDPLRTFMQSIDQPMREHAPLGPQTLSQGRALMEGLEKVADLIALFGDDAMVGDERVLPGALLEEVCAQLAGKASQHRVHLALNGCTPDLSPIYGSRAWLARAMREIVENAIVHAHDAAGESTAAMTVQISARQSGAFLMLSVRNHGAAPAGGASTRASFAPFAKDEGAVGGGLGIGLPLAQRVLELHGGMLRMRTDADGLNEVTVQVPTGAPHQNIQRADMEQARKYAEDLARLLAARRNETPAAHK